MQLPSPSFSANLAIRSSLSNSQVLEDYLELTRPESFIDIAREIPWTPSAFEHNEMIEGMSSDITRVFQSCLQHAERDHSSTGVVSFHCEAPLWRHFFWQRFATDETQQNDSRQQTAHIPTSSRLHDLFGDAALFSIYPTTKFFAFLAPKAYATQECFAKNSTGIALRENDYVAVLHAYPATNSFLVFNPNISKRIMMRNHSLRGASGLCSAEILCFSTPFSITWNADTRLVTASCACWCFDGQGNLTSVLRRNF